MALSKIDSDGIVANGITADSLNIGQIGGRRNLIINGAMQVWQRSTSTVTISDGSNEGYANVDRYQMTFGNAASGAVAWSKSTDAPDGFNNSLKVACSTTTTPDTNKEIRISTSLEGQDVQALAYGGTSPKTATLSFWFKTNKVGLYTVYLETSGTGTRRRYFTFTPAASDTWERVEIQISGDSVSIPDTNGAGLTVALYLINTPTYDDAASSTEWSTDIKVNSSSNVNFMDSTSNELYITGVQLEVGTVATPFEHRSYGEELALCQRYFWKLQGDGTYKGIGAGTVFSTTAFRSYINHPVPMRSAPTYSFSGTLYFTQGASDVIPSSINSIYNGFCDFNTTGATVGNGGAFITGNNQSDYLQADSEL